MEEEDEGEVVLEKSAWSLFCVGVMEGGSSDGCICDGTIVDGVTLAVDVVQGVYNSLLKLAYNAFEVGFVVTALERTDGGFRDAPAAPATTAGSVTNADGTVATDGEGGGAGPHSDLLPQMMLDIAGLLAQSSFGNVPVGLQFGCGWCEFIALLLGCICMLLLLLLRLVAAARPLPTLESPQ